MNSEKNNYFLNILNAKREDIDPQALHILKRLKDSQFDGYLVGGGVRDLLVGLSPKDFDIATNAHPQQIKRKVSNCFIIGRRFKLVHARRGEKIFEIATYRREATLEEIEHLSQENDEAPSFVEENFFGTLKEDAFRRDFSINALFFDPHENALIDLCGGLDDIYKKLLRMIGDPATRIKEDPIRILRAIRLSQKLQFQIEPELRQAIFENIDCLKLSVLPRRREEWLKILKLKKLENLFYELYDLGVLKAVLPTLHELFESEISRENFLAYLRRMKTVSIDLDSNTELFAALMFSYLLATLQQNEEPVTSVADLEKLFNSEKVQSFAKDELGIYKTELTCIAQTFSFIVRLQNTERHLKKGDRRRQAFVTHANFSLAYKLAHLSYLLNPTQICFWKKEIKHQEHSFQSQN